MTKQRSVDQLNGDQTAWVDIPTAAAQLGMTSEAIRQRIKRKTISAEKRDGRWYVALNRPIEQPNATEQPAEPQPITDQSVRDELVEQLRSEVAFLRDQVEIKDQALVEKDEQIRAWIDEAKRKDMLLAHLQERIVELPSSTSESHSDAPDNTQDKPEPRQEPAAPIYSYRIPEPATRPWWQFWRRP